MSRTTTAHYFEHYPHYMGTMNSKFEFDIEEVDEIHDLMTGQENRELADDEQDWYDKMDEVLEHNYAFGEILREWPEIRKALENKGEWADTWEKGSHGISMTCMRDAATQVGLIEARVSQDEFEDEADCW